MNNRRKIIKLGLFSVVAGKAVLSSAIAHASAKTVMGMDSAKPDQKATNNKYYADAKKFAAKHADIQKQLVARAQGKEPKCSTCVLYSADAKEGYGKCLALFQTDLIADAGLCQTWNPKPS